MLIVSVAPDSQFAAMRMPERPQLEGPVKMTVSIRPSWVAALDSLFLRRRNMEMAPAGCYVVGHQGHVFHDEAFGQVGLSQTAPDETTVFRIASCTKSFTAALVLILRDEGKIELDHEVARYYVAAEGLRLPGKTSARPTIRMLLTMSAGFATDNEWADRQESMSTEEFDELVRAGVKFASEPGTRFEYSNLGYAILGRITELVSGVSYIEQIRNRLLGPLGLYQTDFHAPVDSAVLAFGFSRREGVWTSLAQSTPGAFSAIGGLYSTANDLTKWINWLQSAFGSRGAEHPGPLSGESRREMQQLQRFISTDESGLARGYGYGLFVEHTADGKTTISHSGGYPGYSAHMRWNAETGWFAVGLENATYTGVYAPVAEALEMVLADDPMLGHGKRIWSETEEARGLVEAALMAGTLDGLREECEENVEMDLPFALREKALQTILSETGSLEFHRSEITEIRSAGDITWSIPGVGGILVCSMRLSPVNVPRIQFLEFSLS